MATPTQHSSAKPPQRVGHIRGAGANAVPITVFKVSRTTTGSGLDTAKATELAFSAMMAEHTFVSSLIPMYRGYQMRAVAFAMTLYGAAIGLVGAYKDSPQFDRVIATVAGLLPLLILILVMTFHVMEIRIKRASRYIAEDLGPRLDVLLKARRRPPHAAVLRWEKAPGRYLSSFEKWMSGSQAFVLVLAGPSIGAAVWLNVTLRNTPWVTLRVVGFIGVLLLIGFVWFTSTYSAASESRESASVTIPGNPT